MDLVRSWCAGAAVWVAWAAASALLHLWLLPLGALAVPHVRLLWIAATTLTGYTLVALASGLAARPRRVRSREWGAVLPLPVLGAAVEVAALTRNGLDLPALLAALPALALGTFAGHRLTRPEKQPDKGRTVRFRAPGSTSGAGRL
ncbi:hypothetical protein GCM10027570_34330 [Streptomonospora sediminis]